jgi:small subunit ribosomal protein S27Ae
LIQQAKEELNIEIDFSLFNGCSKLDQSLVLENNFMTFTGLAEIAGGKKKKKKVFTTPKRKKHIHKNVKLRALSYFSVNKDGTV